MLVQVLAGADAEEEPAGQHRRRRRGRLGDDRRMDPDGRARDAGADDADVSVACAIAAEDGPHERALALAIDPWMEVVRDQREREPRLLGRCRVLDEIERRMLLARERVPELDAHHRPLSRMRPLHEVTPPYDTSSLTRNVLSQDSTATGTIEKAASSVAGSAHPGEPGRPRPPSDSTGAGSVCLARFGLFGSVEPGPHTVMTSSVPSVGPNGLRAFRVCVAALDPAEFLGPGASRVIVAALARRRQPDHKGRVSA